MGLGLYISRDIISRHGGKIWAESQPGGGTTFYINLPRTAVGAPAAERCEGEK
jgi:signal transduction histidine kinase